MSRAAGDEPLVFISSFAPGHQGAIHAFRLRVDAAALEPLHRTTDVEHPFFLAIAPSGKTLYSIHAKTFGGTEPEHVAAYAIEDRQGHLRLLNRQSSRGTASCYLDVDATGSTVVVANYTSGDVAAFPVREDGSLGESASFIRHTGSSVNPQRQREPHAHCIVISPDNRFALAADLGIDKVLCYRLDAGSAGLEAADPPFVTCPAGAGPRHLTFHPNGRFVYVINELLNSITVFRYDPATAAMRELQTISTLPDDFTGTSHCADVKITPDGRFLYGTNRGHDSIAVYAVGEDGRLQRIGIEPSRGRGPQNLLIAGDGRLLLCANMPGNNVVIFRIDPKSGKLTVAGDPVAITSPSCMRLLP